MREVRETRLPGVGVRHEFSTDSGQDVGVLVYHDGRREILVYDRDDTDACSSLLVLSHDDTRALSELLGATQVSEEIEDARHILEGQLITWIPVAPGGAVDGTTIGSGEYRTRTGATVVAVIRESEPIPAPDPDFVLHGDDLIVAVGRAAALEEFRELIEA